MARTTVVGDFEFQVYLGLDSPLLKGLLGQERGTQIWFLHRGFLPQERIDTRAGREQTQGTQF